MLLRAHRNDLDARANTLRALHRIGRVSDTSAEAVDAAVSNMMPWYFRDSGADALRATFDDMMVAWYRAMGNFPQADK